MALTVSTARALRTPGELRALINAIRAASPTDETDAVEWKGQVPDIESKEWMVKQVARTVLGMANRDPDVAALSFEGCGYLVMGADPGRLEGVRALDPADVDNKLSGYLGSAEPRWRWDNVEVEARTVAVVTVETPHWGDPIHTLRKGHTDLKLNNGDIFVRRNGKTEPADSGDIEALTARARRAAIRLNVEVRWAAPVPLMTAVAVGDEELDAWVEQRVQEMLAQAEIKPDVKPASQPHRRGDANLASLAMAAAAIGMEPETRSLEEYRDEVTSWSVIAREALEAAVREQVASQPDRPGLTPILVNTTERNFVAVRLEMHVPGDVTGHAREEMFRHRPVLPRRPRRFGPVPWNFALGLPDLSSHALLGGRPAEVWVDNGGSATIRYAAVNLRPHHQVDLRPVWLVGGSALAGKSISVSWTATATNVDGAGHGALSVGFEESALGIAAVLSQRAS